MGSDINIELEHKVLAKYNFLIQNKMLSKGACEGISEVLGLLQNSLFEDSSVKEPGPDWLYFPGNPLDFENQAAVGC